MPLRCLDKGQFNETFNDLCMFGQTGHENIIHEAGQLPHTVGLTCWQIFSTWVIRTIRRLFCCGGQGTHEQVNQAAQPIFQFLQENKDYFRPKHLAGLKIFTDRFFIPEPTFETWSTAIKDQQKKKRIELYGVKAATLMEIQPIIEEDADIPAFLPIRHKDIAKHVCSPKFVELWEQFKQSLNIQENTQKRRLTSASKAILDLIRTEVEQNIKQFILPTRIVEWLNLHHEKLLMVRSSGNEDSPTGYNAGCYKSVEAVKSEPTAILEAIRVVVLSYFGDKALERRGNAGEDITQTPLMSFFIQVVASEPVGGAVDPESIYASGIGSYREEAAQTNDVLHLQAAFGHGAAVLSGQFPVDSYHVGPTGKIDKSLRTKLKRLAPKMFEERFQLEYVDNPKLPRSSLTDEQVLKLKALAVKLQSHFKSDIHFEYAVDRQADRIKLLQVKRVKHLKKQSPTFLAFSNISDKGQIRGSMIGSGSGGVVSITSPEELIVADTVSDALPDGDCQSSSHLAKAVVVKTWAPALSHEAVALQSYDIPILLVTAEEWERIKLWKSEENIALAISPQQAFIVNEKIIKRQVREGWAYHPIPTQKTIANISYGQDVVEIIKKLPSASSVANITNDPEKYPLNLLLETIGNKNKAKVFKALAVILQRLTRLSKSFTEHPKLQNIAQKLFRNCVLATAEIIAVYEKPHDRLDILYARKSLEAILKQTPDDVIGSVSYHSILETLKQERRIEKILEKHKLAPAVKPHAVQLLKLLPACLKKGVQKRWLSFVINLAERSDGEKQCGRMAALLKKLGEYNLKETWLNVRFDSLWRDFPKKTTFKERTSGIILNLVKEINHDAETLAWVAENKAIVQRWKAQAKSWANPLKYDSLMDALKQESTLFFPGLVKMQSVGFIARGAIINLLLQTIDALDHSIKEFLMRKGYAKDQIKLKAVRLYEMLRINSNLLARIAPLLDPKMKENLIRGDDDSSKSKSLLFDEHVELLTTASFSTFEKKIDSDDLKYFERQFEIDAAFSVSNWRLGTSKGNHYSFPSLIQIFTIMHQDMLEITSQLKQMSGIQLTHLPRILQCIHSHFDKISVFENADLRFHKRNKIIEEVAKEAHIEPDEIYIGFQYLVNYKKTMPHFSSAGEIEQAIIIQQEKNNNCELLKFSPAERSSLINKMKKIYLAKDGNISLAALQLVKKMIKDEAQIVEIYSMVNEQTTLHLQIKRPALLRNLEEISHLSAGELKYALAKLHQKTGICPTLISHALQRILFTPTVPSYLVNADYAYPYINMRYNFPLCAHSLNIELHYNVNGTLEMKTSWYGDNKDWLSGSYDAVDRMNSVAICTILFSLTFNLEFASGTGPVYNVQSRTMASTWVFDLAFITPNELEELETLFGRLSQCLQMMIAITRPSLITGNPDFFISVVNGENKIEKVPYKFVELKKTSESGFAYAHLRIAEIFDNLAIIEPNAIGVRQYITLEIVKKYPLLMPYYEAHLRKQGRVEEALTLCLETYIDAAKNRSITKAVKIHALINMVMPIENLKIILAKLEDKPELKVEICRRITHIFQHCEYYHIQVPELTEELRSLANQHAPEVPPGDWGLAGMPIYHDH